eukprot:7362436-Prymnesium_polylepis.1
MKADHPAERSPRSRLRAISLAVSTTVSTAVSSRRASRSSSSRLTVRLETTLPPLAAHNGSLTALLASFNRLGQLPPSVRPSTTAAPPSVSSCAAAAF